MNRADRLTAVLMLNTALLVGSGAAFAQQPSGSDGASGQQSAGGGNKHTSAATRLLLQSDGRGKPLRDGQPMGLEATLLLIQSDWSKSPSAAEVEADLARVLKRTAPDGREDKLARQIGKEPAGEALGAAPRDEPHPLARIGPLVLVPFKFHSAAVYRPDDFDALMSWLRKHKLIKATIRAAAVPGKPHPDMEQRPENRRYGFQLTSEVIPVPPPERLASPEDALVTQQARWFWYASWTGPNVQTEWFLSYFEKRPVSQRRLERPVGIPVHAKSHFTLPQDRVVMVSWFPPTAIGTLLRNYARQQGIEPVIVLRDPKTDVRSLEQPPADVQADLHLPQTFLPILTPTGGGRANAARLSGGRPGGALVDGKGQAVPKTPSAQPTVVDASPPDGHAQPASKNGAAKPTYIASGDLVLFIPAARDSVWAFSPIVGKWARQQITPAAKGRLEPIVGNNVAAIQVERTIYAYSGKTGRWDVLRLGGKRKLQLHVGGSRSALGEMVLVSDGQSVYTFANTTGRWTWPGRPAKKDSQAARRPDAELLKLRERYASLDRQAVELAQQYRQMMNKPDRAGQKTPLLKRQLADAVARAFEARQKLQQAELARLRRRLQRIEQQIAARDKIRDAIIRRRVEELLDPNLSWPRVGANKTIVPHSASGSVAAPAAVATSIFPSVAKTATVSPPTAAPVAPSPDGEKPRGAADHASAPVILRSATDFQQELSKARRYLDAFYRYEQSGTAPRGWGEPGTEFWKARVERAKQQLATIEEEYAAQIRLIELALEEAEMAAQVAAANDAIMANRYKANEASRSAALQAKQEAQTAQLRVERVKTLLELYRKVGRTEQPQPADAETRSKPSTATPGASTEKRKPDGD